MLPASDENSGAPAQPLTRANQQHKPAAQHRKRKSVEDSDGTQSSVSAPQAPASTAAGLTTAPGAAARSSSRLRSGQVMMPAIQQIASAQSRSSGPAAKRHHTTGEYPHYYSPALNVDMCVLLLMSPFACQQHQHQPVSLAHAPPLRGSELLVVLQSMVCGLTSACATHVMTCTVH